MKDRLYVSQELVDIIEMVKHPLESYSAALNRLVRYGLENPVFQEHNKKYRQEFLKAIERRNQKENIIKEISRGFERSRINKILIKSLLDDKFDISHLHTIIGMERKIALEEGNDYPELSVSLPKLKKYRKMAIALNEQNPHWRSLYKPKIMDDIQRCYNERKEKGMDRQIRTMYRTKRILEAKYQLDQEIRTAEVLDQALEESGDGHAKPELESAGQEICKKNDEMP